MKGYHDLYLRADVLFFDCVSENFRKEFIKYFVSFSQYEMLRFTDVNLELISGIEKYQFIETVIIGDISMICRVTVEANNKFLKSYHANKPALYTIYLRR